MYAQTKGARDHPVREAQRKGTVVISTKSERIQFLADLQAAIAELAEDVRKNSDEIDQKRPQLFTLIRQAAREGIKPIDLADLTGYSRQRIWQICEGRDVETPPEKEVEEKQEANGGN